MKTKIHTVYKTSEGIKVPGVTTITGQLDKPALIHWAWNLGKKGIDWRKFRDDKADIGTLAHDMVVCYLTGKEPDTSDYTANQINQAENCLLSFYEWEKGKNIDVILAEKPLVSDRFKYGGTPDIVAYVDNVPTLIDIKTGKAIYPEMVYQLSAYETLLEEVKTIYVDNAIILRIGRDETEGFEVKSFSEESRIVAFNLFSKLLDIYYLKKELKEAA